MTQQVRRDVFETNSSSTHSITICSPEDFELLKRESVTMESYKRLMKI